MPNPVLRKKLTKFVAGEFTSAIRTKNLDVISCVSKNIMKNSLEATKGFSLFCNAEDVPKARMVIFE